MNHLLTALIPRKLGPSSLRCSLEGWLMNVVQAVGGAIKREDCVVDEPGSKAVEN